MIGNPLSFLGHTAMEILNNPIMYLVYGAALFIVGIVVGRYLEACNT